MTFDTEEEAEAFTAAANEAFFEPDTGQLKELKIWNSAKAYFDRPAIAEPSHEERDQKSITAKDGDEREAGLSEYGRGYDAGLGEYSDRGLRSQALEIASARGAETTREVILADAKSYLSFLKGESA